MEKIREKEEAISLKGEITGNKKKSLFMFIIYIMLFLNFDTGAVPASIRVLMLDLNLNYKQTSLIGMFYSIVMKLTF